MKLIVWGIIGGVNDQNSIVITVCAGDWAAESAIKASKGLQCQHCQLCVITEKVDWLNSFVTHFSSMVIYTVHEKVYL